MAGILRSGIEHSVVSVWTDGLFCLRFQALGKTPAFATEAMRAELLDRFNEVPRFDLPAGVLDKYPGLPLRLLDDPASMRAFLSVLDWCVADDQAELTGRSRAGRGRRCAAARHLRPERSCA